jgi:ribosomal-protein-alanine N-acetyltransferase
MGSLEYPLPMRELETERLRLRRFRHGDLRDTFAWTGDPEVSRYTFWSVHKTLNDTQQFLDFCFKEYSERGIGPWAAELKTTGVVVGNCSYGAIHLSDARVELAFFFARQCWGQGLAVEGLSALLRFGFEDLGLNRMEARCMPVNVASERVMQKLGMQFEGVLREYLRVKGQFCDLKVYSLLKRDWYEKRSSAQ